MTCKELHQRIEREFREPDTGILNILPEQPVKELLDTPDAPAPEWLLRACRENAVNDDFEEQSVPASPTQPIDRTTLVEKLRWATEEAERRNRGYG